MGLATDLIFCMDVDMDDEGAGVPCRAQDEPPLAVPMMEAHVDAPCGPCGPHGHAHFAPFLPAAAVSEELRALVALNQQREHVSATPCEPSRTPSPLPLMPGQLLCSPAQLLHLLPHMDTVGRYHGVLLQADSPGGGHGSDGLDEVGPSHGSHSHSHSHMPGAIDVGSMQPAFNHRLTLPAPPGQPRPPPSQAARCAPGWRSDTDSPPPSTFALETAAPRRGRRPHCGPRQAVGTSPRIGKSSPPAGKARVAKNSLARRAGRNMRRAGGAARGEATASSTTAGTGQSWPPLPLDVLEMPTIEFDKWRRRADSIATYGSIHDAPRLRKERRRYKNMHYARNARQADKSGRAAAAAPTGHAAPVQRRSHMGDGPARCRGTAAQRRRGPRIKREQNQRARGRHEAKGLA